MREFIPVYRPDLSGNELSYVTDCVTSTWISSLGEYIARFEQEFAAFCGVKHAIACTNGTAALHLALAACGIGSEDEVILPTLTFVATANAVSYTGARPILVDSDLTTWTIDPDLIESRITSHTKAIVAVHLYGHPADMEPILSLADRHGLLVLEDAAEAHGAEYKGRRVGGLGCMGAFSFYGNKIITTGEGGMLTTNETSFAATAGSLKDHCMSRESRYWHTAIGFNYRMTNVQAAIGVAQLERVEAILARKRELARLYDAGLAECWAVIRPPEANWARNVYWMYSILISEDSVLNRDQLMAALRTEGIDTRPFFVPMHQLPQYAQDGHFPVAEALSRNGLNLPSYPTIPNIEVERICYTINRLCGL